MLNEPRFKFTELARADDTVWALPTREPEKSISYKPSIAERQAIALERIADYLNNIQVMLLDRQDDGW